MFKSLFWNNWRQFLITYDQINGYIWRVSYSGVRWVRVLCFTLYYLPPPQNFQLLVSSFWLKIANYSTLHKFFYQILTNICSLSYQFCSRSIFDQYLVSIWSILGSIWPVLDQYFISISWIFGSIWIVLDQYLISIWSIFEQCPTSDAQPVYYQYLTFFLAPLLLNLPKTQPC